MAKKMFRLNKKSISFGVGPLRANIGTRGVKNSLRVGGQTFTSKTSKWKGGGSSSGTTVYTLVDTTPAGPPVRFVTTKSKWLGVIGFSLVALGIVTLCNKPVVGAVMVGVGIFIFAKAQRIDPDAAKGAEAAALSEGEPTGDDEVAAEIEDGDALAP